MRERGGLRTGGACTGEADPPRTTGWRMARARRHRERWRAGPGKGGVALSKSRGSGDVTWGGHRRGGGGGNVKNAAPDTQAAGDAGPHASDRRRADPVAADSNAPHSSRRAHGFCVLGHTPAPGGLCPRGWGNGRFGGNVWHPNFCVLIAPEQVLVRGVAWDEVTNCRFDPVRFDHFLCKRDKHSAGSSLRQGVCGSRAFDSPVSVGDDVVGSTRKAPKAAAGRIVRTGVTVRTRGTGRVHRRVRLRTRGGGCTACAPAAGTPSGTGGPPDHGPAAGRGGGAHLRASHGR